MLVKLINSQAYKYEENYAVTIKISMTKYHQNLHVLNCHMVVHSSTVEPRYKEVGYNKTLL